MKISTALSVILTLFCLVCCSESQCQTLSIDELVSAVQALCKYGADGGQRDRFEITCDANADVRILKIIGKAGAGGEVKFTHEEWSGIPQVSEGKQAEDNASYRTCVAKITPIVLERFVPKEPKVNEATTGPNEMEMKRAVERNIQIKNTSIRQMQDKCKDMYASKSQLDAIFCLQSLIINGTSGSPFKIEIMSFEKHACAKAIGVAGYICDFSMELSFSGGSSAVSEWKPFINGKSYAKGRFLKTGTNWEYFPIE